MHSVDKSGQICINLDDFNELLDSIRFRHKIDYLADKLECPKDISNFSVSILFKNGQEQERIVGAVSKDAIAKVVGKYV